MAVLSTGCFTPVGTNTVETATSIFAGISGIVDTPFTDERFENLRMGQIPSDILGYVDGRSMYGRHDLHPFLHRLLSLAVPALRECLTPFVNQGEIPWRISLSTHASFDLSSNQRAFLDLLSFHGEIACDVRNSQLVDRCRTGFYHQLAERFQKPSADSYSEVLLVGGTDSFWNLSSLYALLKAGRLLTYESTGGFIPGEGAAFLLLGSRRAARELGIEPLAWIHSVGLGNEPGHRLSKKPYLGDGLDQAVKRALQGVVSVKNPIRTVFAGLNGEGFCAKEWGVACLRSQEYFGDDFEIEHPAEYVGDAKAALSPIMAAVVAFGLHHGLWRGPVLLWASADQAERGAMVLSSSPE